MKPRRRRPLVPDNMRELRRKLRRPGSEAVITNMPERMAIVLAHQVGRMLRVGVKARIVPEGVHVRRLDEPAPVPQWGFDAMAVGDQFTADLAEIARLRVAASRAGKATGRRFSVGKHSDAKAVCERTA